MPLRLRRGTDSTRTSITPVQGEPIYTTDTKKLFIGDGTTAGGVEIGGTSVANSSNDRIITSDGTSTGLVAESNLSFNGTQLNVTGSIIATSLTGSLQGSSSYSNQSLSSSFATNSSTAQTASYVLNAVSASFATNSSTAQTASYVLNAVSSSFATNSSTASYVLNAVSSSFATTASFVLGGISSFSVNSPVNGRVLLSDGTTNAATASANLYFTGSQNTLIVSSSLVISGSSVFEEDVAINNIKKLAVSNIRPNNEILTISGSVYHNSGSFVYTPTFVDYQEKFTTVGIVGNALNLNLDNGNVFTVTINSAISTFTITNPPFGGNAGNIVLITTGNGTTYPITWAASISWPGGTPPTVTSTNGKKDVYGFISLDQGTNWYGFIGGQNI
jgi:hypothetical protein